MNADFTFWYVSITEVQLGLEGKEFHKNVLLEGHIEYGGRLMCEQSREVLQNQMKKKYEAQTVSGVTFKVCQGRTKICPLCTAAFMKHPQSPYYAWVKGIAKTPKTKLPSLAKF